MLVGVDEKMLGWDTKNLNSTKYIVFLCYQHSFVTLDLIFNFIYFKQWSLAKLWCV